MTDAVDSTREDRHLTIRVLATPANVNSGGDIFGGWLMSQVDIAGSILANKRAAGRVVTVAIESFRFLKPVLVGDLVSCYARVNRIGRTSITIDVDTFVERKGYSGDPLLVSDASITYVALDRDGNKRVIPR